jgi:DNA-binding transcriptional regulator YdaS (Cro superfamily)
MKLKQYLELAGRGARMRLSAATGAYPSDITDWANGDRPIPYHWAVKLEAATTGAVMRWDSRPDDWHEHWPELRRRKDAPPIPLKTAA